MSTKSRKLQILYHEYKELTGNDDVEMKEVAKYVADKGWMFKIPDPLDRLADDIAQAIREEIRHDKDTGKPYRANHAYRLDGKQRHIWFDIDENPPRKKVHSSLMMRRQQMVGDGLQLTLDADHWNNVHPQAEPIIVPMDFTDDVEWAKNTPDEKAG